MLAASAYTADDYARFGCYRGKCYKWGYFPEAKKYDPDELMKGKLSAASDGLKRPCVSILWAGRLIDLCENIISDKKAKSSYANGVCSEARVMENDWFCK